MDIVYVNVIHPVHKANTILALENGKHVLCEKPLAMNAKEVEEMIKVAKDKNLMLMEAVWTRFFPAIDKVTRYKKTFTNTTQVRQLLNENAIGKVHFAHATFGFKHSGQPRLVDRDLGGGALLDVGIYVLSFASMIFGGKYPTSIDVSGSLLPSQVDGQSHITLKYPDNQVASLYCSILEETPREAVVIGTNGYIKIHAPFWCPTKISLHIGNNEPQVFEYSLPSKIKTFNIK